MDGGAPLPWIRWQARWGRRRPAISRLWAGGDLMMDGELAGLPGFSARQGEQEVHGVGMAIGWDATRLLTTWPGCSVEEKEDPLA